MKTESNEKWVVCRVCLNNPSEGEELLHDIFSETASTRLDQMLHICAGIPVSVNILLGLPILNYSNPNRSA